MGESRERAHEDVHVFVEAVVCDEVVGHLDAVRLHRVDCGWSGMVRVRWVQWPD